MYAIVNLKGFQYKAENNKFIYVPDLNLAVGESITLSEIVLLSDGSNTKIGTPFVSGASVSLKVLENKKSDKVIVFKKIRRKGFRKKVGHRQMYTKVLVEKISV